MSDSTVTAGSDRLDPSVWRILSVALLGPLITILDSTVVNVALTTVGHDLNAALTSTQWVITGYLLGLVLMLPLSGWLVNRFGAKRLYLVCFGLFTAASVLCGASTSIQALIGARVLQGLAGGLLGPMAQMMIVRAAPGHIARVTGILAIPVLLGPICGPALAGLILQHASWHWLFFINVPIGIFAITLSLWFLPKDEAPVAPRRFDFTGFFLISPGLVLFLHSLESMVSDPGARSLHLLELLVALTLLCSFSVHALRRGTAALVDLQLFRDASFAAAALTQFTSNAMNYGGQMLLRIYMLIALQFSPGKAGLLLTFSGLGALCSYPWMGPLTERFGPRRLSTAGALVALCGLLPFALVPAAAMSTWIICVALFVRGVGMSSIGIPSLAAAYSSIPSGTIPVATTAINIVQRLGGPIATTLLAIFLHAWSTRAVIAGMPAAGGSRAGISATLWLLCAFQFATVLAALRLPRGVVKRARPTSA